MNGIGFEIANKFRKLAPWYSEPVSIDFHFMFVHWHTKSIFLISIRSLNPDSFHAYVWHMKNSIKYLNGKKINRNKNELQTARNKLYTSDDQKTEMGRKAIRKARSFAPVTGRWKKSNDREMYWWNVKLGQSDLTINHGQHFYSIFLTTLILLCRKYSRLQYSETENIWACGEKKIPYEKIIFREIRLGGNE